MEWFFLVEKLLFIGNLVRVQLQDFWVIREEGVKYFGFDLVKFILFVLGGSLGVWLINEVMVVNVEVLKVWLDVQVFWQVGKFYEVIFIICEMVQLFNVKVQVFIDGMDLAYMMVDVIVVCFGVLMILEL